MAYDDPVGVAREIARVLRAAAFGLSAIESAAVTQRGAAITMARLYGGETAKAVKNFPISGEPVPVEVVRWLGRIKGAAARANGELGLLDPKLAKAIAEGRRRGRRPARTTSSSRSTSSRPARARRRT